jgi:hypothetical protein
MLLELQPKEDATVVHGERVYKSQLQFDPIAGPVELFERGT